MAEAFDFKGNPLFSTRQLAQEYKTAVNWRPIESYFDSGQSTTLNLDRLQQASAPLLEVETFITRTTYDALDRPASQTTPDKSVTENAYNEANLLEAIEVNLRGEEENGERKWTPFVKDIDYDAKGQRTRIEYGNGVITTYTYDDETFRLVHLLTRRPGPISQTTVQSRARQAGPAVKRRTCAIPTTRRATSPTSGMMHSRSSSSETSGWSRVANMNTTHFTGSLRPRGVSIWAKILAAR